MSEHPSTSPGSMPDNSLRTRLMDLYHRLLGRYGPQGWWPGDGAFETIIGAILTQNAAWTNVEKALANLKGIGALTPQRLRAIPEEGLAQLVRPSGYFNSKARKLKAFVGHMALYGDSLEAMFDKDRETLRQELLGIYGIGEETADDIVLYAAGKPSFVIDAYTRRILRRLGLAPGDDSYQAYRALFQENLAADTALYNEFHALLDRHAGEACRKKPLCDQCCLRDICPTGRGQMQDPARPL